MFVRRRRDVAWLACCVCCAMLAGLILTAIFASYFVNLKVYRYLVSPPLEFDTAFGVPEAGDAPRIYIAQCTNETGTSIPIKFQNHGKLVISYLCPQTKNQCELNVCNADYQCEKVVVQGECSEDTECYSAYGPNYRCNTTTCSCQIESQCLTSADCPRSSSPCSNYVCNGSNVCVEELNLGATCSSSDQCFAAFNDSNYKCDQTTCACEFHSPLEANISCLVDSECPVTNTLCSAFACVGGFCVESLIDGATCGYSESCVTDANNSYYSCSWSTCQCIFSPPVNINHTCVVDADCPLLLETCSSFICVSGFCEEALTTNATCSEDTQCQAVNGTDYYCDLNTCTCALRLNVVPDVMFLSKDSSSVSSGNSHNVTFNTTQATVGDVFYAHSTPTWTAVNLTDAGAFYLIWFKVQASLSKVDVPKTIYLNSIGSAPSTIIPGCYATAMVLTGSTTDDVKTEIIGHCMIPAAPYATSGIQLVVLSNTASGGGGTVTMDATDYSASLMIQKLS